MAKAAPKPKPAPKPRPSAESKRIAELEAQLAEAHKQRREIGEYYYAEMQRCRRLRSLLWAAGQALADSKAPDQDFEIPF